MQQSPPPASNHTDAEGKIDSNGLLESCELEPACSRLNTRIEAFLSTESSDEIIRATQEQTRVGLQVIEDALDRYRLDQISLSYNGGKDCLVLLVLFLAALHRRGLASHLTTLKSVYILSKHPFKEVDEFVDETARAYRLDLKRYAKPMKEAFEDYLKECPQIEAIFVGTRRTDPHGAHLTHFDPTDRGWPAFMRIHPVIDWHYVEVWTFIRQLKIPYCSLYDKGYTSLGGTTDTNPNPALRKEAFDEVKGSHDQYLPAYELMEDHEERLGRAK